MHQILFVSGFPLDYGNGQNDYHQFKYPAFLCFAELEKLNGFVDESAV